MIKSFKHAGLERFFKTGSKAGIQPAHSARLAIQLEVLNRASNVFEMNVPGWKLHQLKGDLSPQWSMKVDRLWRITFVFDDGDATVVDYQDYHTG